MKNLIPAIVQDADTSQVLMLGYMNQEALQKTRETRLVTFYSRSKKRLWQKGETSGNRLELVEIKEDCDQDALLILARPTGPTCHTGSTSCFSNDPVSSLEVLGRLIRKIDYRSKNADASTSYTKELLDGGVEACGAKVLEEAEEVVRAARLEGKQRTIEEAADVLYHLLTLLKVSDVSFDSVLQELQKRSQ